MSYKRDYTVDDIANLISDIEEITASLREVSDALEKSGSVSIELMLHTVENTLLPDITSRIMRAVKNAELQLAANKSD